MCKYRNSYYIPFHNGLPCCRTCLSFQPPFPSSYLELLRRFRSSCLELVHRCRRCRRCSRLPATTRSTIRYYSLILSIVAVVSIVPVTLSFSAMRQSLSNLPCTAPSFF
ncbi:uncharacterized protein EI97DRAFT_137461 [Westerdykella ornata]|uniref:Uncharacterized protein n=1 Tax=Westerdykella ornata TaxID=318751 RepID=A0A6A6JCK6_WESOR|nr:uncharacterized protein EI97DRAFT_137461 [Westerdykella ornata]KAF2274162.1 hypothetical protein EI97DRAFT_137461 [Westerdykella ornata]